MNDFDSEIFEILGKLNDERDAMGYHNAMEKALTAIKKLLKDSLPKKYLPSSLTGSYYKDDIIRDALNAYRSELIKKWGLG